MHVLFSKWKWISLQSWLDLQLTFSRSMVTAFSNPSCPLVMFFPTLSRKISSLKKKSSEIIKYYRDEGRIISKKNPFSFSLGWDSGSESWFGHFWYSRWGQRNSGERHFVLYPPAALFLQIVFQTIFFPAAFPVSFCSLCV